MWFDDISPLCAKWENKEILGTVSATLLTRARDGWIEWRGLIHLFAQSRNTVKTNSGAPRFGLDWQNKHFSACPWCWCLRARARWVCRLGGKKREQRNCCCSWASTLLSPQPNRCSSDSLKFQKAFGYMGNIREFWLKPPHFSPERDKPIYEGILSEKPLSLLDLV